MRPAYPLPLVLPVAYPLSLVLPVAAAVAVACPPVAAERGGKDMEASTGSEALLKLAVRLLTLDCPITPPAPATPAAA